MTNSLIKRAKLNTLVFGVCVLIFIDVSADQESDYQRSINNIGQQIKKISKNLNANKALLKTEQDKLSEIEQKVNTINKQITATSNNIKLQHEASIELELEISKLSKTHEQDKYALAQLIRQQYQLGKSNYFKMILNQENPYAVGRLSHYYDYFAKAKNTKLTEVGEQIIKAYELDTSHQKLLGTLEAEQRTQSKQKQSLRTAKQSRQKSVEKLNHKVETSSNKLKRLKRDRERLNTLLTQITAQAQELRVLEQQHEERKGQNKIYKEKQTKIIRPTVKGGFLKQKGRLNYPVAGRPKYQFGSRLIESGMRSQGTFFNTHLAEPVKTIFRGRVLFADYLKGYGLLIIVDHGDEHISLYGHNEVLYKKVGDRVETNEVIATSGVSGGLKTPGLYFEIRKSVTPVNPAVWCQI